MPLSFLKGTHPRGLSAVSFMQVRINAQSPGTRAGNLLGIGFPIASTGPELLLLGYVAGYLLTA